MLVVGLLPNYAHSLTLEDLGETEKQAYTQQQNQWVKEYEEEQERQRKTKELTEKANSLKGKYGGQCVIFAKKFLGVTESWGLARNVKTNTSTPVIGSVIKTSESWAGHVGIVINATKTTVTIIESNYIRNTIGIRTLSITDKRIKGYKIIN